MTACRSCGCTDRVACIVDHVPCRWVEPDLCSACLPGAKARNTCSRDDCTETRELRVLESEKSPGKTWLFYLCQRHFREFARDPDAKLQLGPRRRKGAP